MNRIDVRALPHRGQYLAQFRRVHKAEFETVEKNGEPILYPTEDKAKLAAWEAMTAHLCTLMTRDGVTISNAKAAAERLFTRKANGQGEARFEEEAGPPGGKGQAQGIEACGP